ncbi:MAG: RNA-directed DNA polymerase [Clostridia bacterium]
MPHKIKNVFLKSQSFELLYQAHLRAKKNKTNRNELISFEINLENNLINLLNNIKKGTYHLGKYTTFIIYEPKRREIMSLPYKDRIIHQWYVEEFIKPYIVPKLITDTFACITDRGTHKAIDKVQEYMKTFYRNNGDFWILKCDIKKFFYSIDKNILFEILKKYISDKKLLDFTRLIIFEKQSASKKGIPIGNYTSQFFANIYLNELDQFAKHNLHLKYYVRYMDDFIIILKSKEECKKIKKEIELFLHENLELELNHKSHYYPHKFGLDFCGYRIFTTHRLLRTNSKKKIKRKVSSLNKMYRNNSLDFKRAMFSINSWIGHSSHANTYTLRKKIINKCDFLYTSKVIEDEENYIHNLIDNESKVRNKYL